MGAILPVLKQHTICVMLAVRLKIQYLYLKRLVGAQLGEELDMAAVRSGQLTPMFFGSAMNNFGVQLFLETFISLASPPGGVTGCLLDRACLFPSGCMHGVTMAQYLNHFTQCLHNSKSSTRACARRALLVRQHHTDLLVLVSLVAGRGPGGHRADHCECGWGKTQALPGYKQDPCALLC